jgi:Ser/Thr protein kinase RdoA (MazF antagonist)
MTAADTAPERSTWLRVAAEHWPGLDPVRVLTGGARNLVVLARYRTEHVVVRRSSRSRASLAWELDLLEHLAAAGMRVPRPVPSDGGLREVDGIVVQERLRGQPPRSDGDWQRVAAALEILHEHTVGWPQRPGSASSAELLDRDAGGDVRLDAMPARLVGEVRRAWAALQVGPPCVVHGDVGAGNVLVDGDTVGLLDWDEARVDVRWFDLADLPVPVDLPDAIRPEALATAGLAWETATCWVAEPDHARACAQRLAARTPGLDVDDPAP